MLPIHVLSKYNLRPSSIVLSQWINVGTRSYASSDSSSSDSDSDNEKVKSKRMYVKNANRVTSNKDIKLGNFLDNMIKQETKSIQKSKSSIAKQVIDSKKMDQNTAESKETTNLMDYINNMMTAKKLEKTIDVAVSKKKPKDASNTHLSYEKRLTKAAENVADALGGDKTKTTSDLLQKVLARKVSRKVSETEKLTRTKPQKQEEIRQSLGDKTQDLQTENYSTQKSVIHDLLKEYKKQSFKTNITKRSLNDGKTSAQIDNIKRPRRQDIDLWNGNSSGIFDNMRTASPDIPELKTWTALQQRELKILTIYPPANIFQEMILWTEQGKLWKFPIDNEQGMEEEHNVHFSEHIFLERHLKDWCPKSGPIRHFMELVCNGLSKNPYMTVQEKIDHIMWYKEYFESKQDLLQELGAIQEPFPDKANQIRE